MTQAPGDSGRGMPRAQSFAVSAWMVLFLVATPGAGANGQAADEAPVATNAVSTNAVAAVATNAVADEAVVPAAEATLAAATPVAAPPVTSEKSPDFSGRLRAVYDYRSMGDDKDSDLYGYWYLNGKDLADGHLDLYSSGRHRSDLDGTHTSYADDAYVSSDDTDGDQDTRVLQLYADVHDKDGDVALRAGRQYVEVADYIQMDGAQLMLFEPRDLGGRVFAGKPVSFYSPVSGDLFAGTSVSAKPWDGNVSRLTYARYEDDSENAADDALFLNMRQRAGDSMQARGQASLMNSDFRMGSLDLWYFGTDRVSDLMLGVRHWGSYSAESRVYSPLYEVLGKASPYTYTYIRTTQEIVTWFLVSPGAAWQFMDSSDEDAQNQGYGHYDLSFMFEPTRSLDATLAVEYWDVQDGDRFTGFSGEVRYRQARLWEVAVGAAYLDYQYRQYSDFSYRSEGGDVVLTTDGTSTESSPNVYTYFLRGKWRVNPHLVVRLQGDIEDDSQESDQAYRGRASVEIPF